MERKTLEFEVKQVDEGAGIFEGYAATFSKQPDSYGDIIEPGAFSKTLQEGGKRIKILWQHNVNEPLGKPTEITQDEKGLLVKGKLSLGVQRAREVLNLMKDSVITELSIGYDAINAPMVEGIRHLKEIKLWDISPVIFAANPEAIITAVKQSELKPYPNEHACRLRNPDDFQPDTFRRITRESDGKKYSIIMGKLKDEDTMTEQAYRYDKDTWPADEARSHCEKHDGQFEAAGKALLVRGAEHTSSKGAEQITPKETDPITPEDREAAKLDAVLTELKVENEGFDVKQAERRIEVILQSIKGETDGT